MNPPEQIKVVSDYPPIWEEVLAQGMRPNPKTVVFTYGTTIYTPGGVELLDHVVEHEKIHMVQQGYTEEGAKEWWARYIADPYWRIAQEAEAYGYQYAYITEKVRDRNTRAKVLNDLGLHLSGPMYGKVISHQAAMKMIKEHSKVK